MKEKFNVTGMTCSACQNAVEKSVKALGANPSVNLISNKMTVEFDENTTNPEQIIKAVEKAGYKATLLGDKSKSTSMTSEDPYKEQLKQMKSRLIVSSIFMVALFYIAMGPMMGLAQFSFLSGEENLLNLGILQMLLTIPIMAIDFHYYRSGFKALWHRNPNMDSLIAIGTSAAFVYSLYAVFKISNGLGHGDMSVLHTFGHSLYFESAGMILVLITLGKYFEQRAKSKTSSAINQLMDLTPKKAVVIRDSKEVEIKAEEIVKGDIILVKPGSNIVVDGVIIEGQTTIDESALTGESLPVEKSVGDKIMSGTTNKTGFIKFRAESETSDSTIAKIVELVEDANTTKAPIAKLADKIAGVFVPIVMAIALVTFVYWIFKTSDVEFAMSMAISVLVISCPCALGLATPVAIMVGTGRGAKFGVLFKSAESLETLHLAKEVLLDKTGTITTGIFSVKDIITNNIEENEFLKIAASIEKNSEHPLAQSIVKEAENRKLDLYKSKNFVSLSGMGVICEVENKNYLVGNQKLMEEEEIDISNFIEYANKFAEEAKTPIYFADEKGIIGIISLADTLKANSKTAIKDLQNMGIKVSMVTGDNKKTAKVFAKEVGIDEVFAEVLPNEKEKILRDIATKDKVKTVFVGDGINDAPSLVRADVGVAIGAGTDIAIESADVVLIKNELSDLVTAIKLSKATIKNIKENLFWAFFYNILGIPIAAGLFYYQYGLKLNPMIGALAMGFSSIFVVTNALRLNKFKIK